MIDGEKSRSVVLLYGVPQGSNFGPKAFKRYDRPVGLIADKHDMNYHIYADDVQLYVSFEPGNGISERQALDKLLDCINELNSWMTANFLKLNQDKTEILVFKRAHHNITDELNLIDIGGNVIHPAHSARNLGVVFDTSLTLECHIKKVCKNAYFEIRNISKIRKYLTDAAAATLVHAFVTSKLDYCNSLLYGLPKKTLQKLQRVLNSAARVVGKCKKYDSITPTLVSFHWLSIPERIEFKILLLTFKALHGQAPIYLSELLKEHSPCRDLRSAESKLLAVPKTRLKYFGDRAFVKAAPLLWNALPRHIRFCNTTDCFKSNLKTYLFKRSYNV